MCNESLLLQKGKASPDEQNLCLLLVDSETSEQLGLLILPIPSTSRAGSLKMWDVVVNATRSAPQQGRPSSDQNPKRNGRSQWPKMTPRVSSMKRVRYVRMVRDLETDCQYLFVHHVIKVSRVHSNLRLGSSVIQGSLRYTHGNENQGRRRGSQRTGRYLDILLDHKACSPRRSERRDCAVHEKGGRTDLPCLVTWNTLGRSVSSRSSTCFGFAVQYWTPPR